MNSTLPPIPSDIVSMTGPRLIGYLLHWGLFGVLSTQVYMYYLAFPKDSMRNKAFVYSVYILDVIQTVIITMSAFHVFAAGYGDFAFYNSIRLTWFSVPVISGAVAFLAEIFYAYRIRILAQSYWFAGIITGLAVVQLGGAIASAVVIKKAGLYSELLSPHFSITAGVWNGGSALCDVIIATCMTYYLSRRSSGGLESTQVLLKRIIRLVIETGMATAAIAVLNLVLALMPKHTSYYQVPSDMLAKVYANSMMVLLNSRMRISSDLSDSTISTRLQTEVFRRSTDAYDMNGGVNVTVTREEMVFSLTEKEDVLSSQNKGYIV